MAPLLLVGTVAFLCSTLSKEEQWTATGPGYRMQEWRKLILAHVYCAFWLRGLGTTVQMLKNVCRDHKIGDGSRRRGGTDAARWRSAEQVG
jgi:hypothetical protein